MKLIGTSLILICVAGTAWCAPTVRVVSYNIHHGRGLDGEVDLERIAAVIQDLQPDIVCLQEVDQGVDRTDGLDMPNELARLLDMQVVFGPNLSFQGGLYGNAILTRFPIRNYDNLPLPRQSGGEQRGCQRVEMEIEDRIVTVLNTHLGLDPAIRKQQASAILNWIAPVAHPLIVAGDLNEPPDGEAVQMLLSRFIDTFNPAEDQPSGTFNEGDGPRIDYILASPDWRSVSSRIVLDERSRVASDHLPYVAELELPRKDTTDDEWGILLIDHR